MNVKEVVRAKNMDLLLHSYNKEASKLNREGFINKEDKDVKKLRDKYEALVARFDTDKNTKKQDKEYNYNIHLDSKEITGIRGVKPTLKIKSEGMK